MKRIFLFLSSCILAGLAIVSVNAAQDKIWDFTTQQGISEWSANASVAYEITPDGTVFSATEKDNNDMQLTYRKSLGSLDLSDYEIFAVEYSDTNGGGSDRRAQFYHWTEGSSGNPRIDIPLSTGEHIFMLNMKDDAPASACWKGTVERLRFDPIRGAGKRSVTIKFVGLFSTEDAYNEYMKAKNPEAFTQPGYVTEPGTGNYTFGYTTSNAYVDIDYVNGYAVITSLNGPEDGGNGDCNVTAKVDFSADNYPWIKMRIRNLSAANVFEFHFATEATGKKITADSCTHFPITAYDTEFKEYVFNVKDYNLKSMAVNNIENTESVWKGKANLLRFDCMWLAEPSGQMPTGSQMYIDYIAFLPTKEAAEEYQPKLSEAVTVNSGKPCETILLKNLKDAEKWNLGQLDFSAELGLVKLKPTGSDPTMSIGLSNPVDTAEFKYFAMHYNIKSNVRVGGLFYTTDKIPSITDASYSEFAINNRGEWSDVIVDLSKYPKQNWKGTCYSIRLDPINGNDTDAEIMIERMGFFRTIEEAQEFLAKSQTVPDYSLGASYNDTLQKVIIAPGSLYEGYKKEDFMLSSTIPQGEAQGVSPVVMRLDENGNKTVVALGYTNSYGYTTFSVNRPGNYILGYNHKVYDDISGHWAEKYIDFVSDRTLFGGTSPTEFSPEAAMTRGMFITVLGRMHGVDTSKYNGNTGYGDVNSAEYYAPYIQWAKEYGLMDGLSDVTFGAEDPIYRKTMALVISNYITAFGYELHTVNDILEFTDLTDCDVKTVQAINNAQTAGIINGKGEGRFDPEGVSTRAEVATVMERTIKSVLGVNMVSTQYAPEFYQRKRIRLGVWGFEGSQANEKGMNLLKDLGVDLIVSGTATNGSNKNYVLNYADKNGIEVFIQSSPVVPSSAEGFDYRNFVAEYADHPSFSGNYIIDEPGTDSYPELGKISNDYMAALPGKIPFTNLLPMYANAAQLKMGAGAAAIEYYDSDPDLYRKYCQQWFEYFDCNYICTDIYPFSWNGVGREAINKITYNEYVESINQIATVARENNKEFWCCIQTFGWNDSKRTPNEAEYRWQCYSMLSFGCTGILLWRYMSGEASLVRSSNGEPTQAYYDCKPVMWEMRALSDTFVQYKNLGAFTHNPQNMPYLKMSGEYAEFDVIESIDCTQPLLIGCFEKEDASGAAAFTLVNMADFSTCESAVVNIKLADTVKTVTSYYRGKPVVITPVEGVYTFSLENGDGVFVTVE
ncbi:MAG: S-layer homology domain-containing protein [Ruminococcaceae bacterium]|nr:S-layer homology domain-containing protein [Oscillospiraceae bacterium]